MADGKSNGRAVEDEERAPTYYILAMDTDTYDGTIGVVLTKNIVFSAGQKGLVNLNQFLESHCFH